MSAMWVKLAGALITFLLLAGSPASAQTQLPAVDGNTVIDQCHLPTTSQFQSCTVGKIATFINSIIGCGMNVVCMTTSGTNANTDIARANLGVGICDRFSDVAGYWSLLRGCSNSVTQKTATLNGTDISSVNGALVPNATITAISATPAASKLYDNGNANGGVPCPLVQAVSANQPILVWPYGPTNMPPTLVTDGTAASGVVSSHPRWIDSNGGCSGIPRGNASRTLVSVISSAYVSWCCGGFGEFEAPGGGPAGVAFAHLLSRSFSGNNVGAGCAPTKIGRYISTDLEVNGLGCIPFSAGPKWPIVVMTKWDQTTMTMVANGDIIYQGPTPGGETLNTGNGSNPWMMLGRAPDGASNKIPLMFSEGFILNHATTSAEDVFIQENVTLAYGPAIEALYEGSLPGLTGAFSFARVVPAYPGPVVNMTCSNPSATTDFFSSSFGMPDPGCSGTLTLNKIYDQSGMALHVPCTAPGPTVTVNAQGGWPTIATDSTHYCVLSDAAMPSTAGALMSADGPRSIFSVINTTLAHTNFSTSFGSVGWGSVFVTSDTDCKTGYLSGPVSSATGGATYATGVELFCSGATGASYGASAGPIASGVTYTGNSGTHKNYVNGSSNAVTAVGSITPINTGDANPFGMNIDIGLNSGTAIPTQFGSAAFFDYAMSQTDDTTATTAARNRWGF